MKSDFTAVIAEHIGKYPCMEPQDLGKLAYQSEFGPEHLIADRQQAIDFLKKEWDNLPPDSTPHMPESIGGGLCRFPLSVCRLPDEIDLLADLFILTARLHHGSREGLSEKIAQLEQMPVPGMGEWLEEWKRQQCPPVHHSRAYNVAYQPHYRLVEKAYADYFDIFLTIKRLLRERKQVIVAIDGRCGSGKSYLAKLLETLFSCQVIHMDDFYLPFCKRQENWMDIPAGNMDLERFAREILRPLTEDGQAVYRPYNCRKDEMGEAILLDEGPLIVVEGSYSQHPVLKEAYDLRIFLTCGKEEQRKRLREREGSHFPAFEEKWIPLEENYLRCYPVERDSQIVMDTSGVF
ncbi:MAG: hypothetical protein NC419_06500 [Muribaculaceae bacterium]|nr:hypothetical protein [Muribaculaceae bacterium]